MKIEEFTMSDDGHRVYRVEGSEPGTYYTVRIRGRLPAQCSCPDWYFRQRKKRKNCKHIDAVLKEYPQ